MFDEEKVLRPSNSKGKRRRRIECSRRCGGKRRFDEIMFGGEGER